MNRSMVSALTTSGAKARIPRITSQLSSVGKRTVEFARVKASDPMLRQTTNFCFAVGCAICSVVAWQRDIWPLTVLCWIVGGHFFHTFALSFHDAAHGTLHPDRKTNEFLGHFYGTLILVPLTVYRRAHARHHALLASIDDPELYPFVDPGTGRFYRIVCACAEIIFGYFYTPMLFARSVFTDPKLTDSVRRQITREYALIAAVMIPAVLFIAVMHLWEVYLVGIVLPVLVAGSYQTLRKYTEHLGLNGSTILQSTRSILPRDQWNKTISSLMQHVDHHGTHHVQARIPFSELPPASEELYRERAEDLPVFPHYAAAIWDMVITLPDPKAGAQWLDEGSNAPSPGRLA